MMPFEGTFADEIRAFAAADQLAPPPVAPTLFYGSSSIRLWSTLAEDFPQWTILNRGFGGSTLGDCVWFFDWLVKPYAPSSMVFYAGDNDLDQRAAPEHVSYLFTELVKKTRNALGDIPITFISIKPSPARWWNIHNIVRTNALVENFTRGQSNVSFLNVLPEMLNSEGHPRRELYEADGLHLNRMGYSIWVRHLTEHQKHDHTCMVAAQ